MGISLGTRISVVLLAGAVAVVTVALQEGDAPRVRGGGVVPEASSSAVRSTPAVTSSPAPRTGGLEGGTVGRSTPAPSVVPEAPALPTPSPGRTPRVVTVSWLPPGPVSPDADRLADPDSVYDVLRSPARCREALGMIPGGELGDEWRVLKALAHACLAARGEGGSWAEASEPVRGVSGKGVAARRVLGELLAFRCGARGGDSVRLVVDSGGVPACSFGVRVVGGGEVAAGDVVRVRLRGRFFGFGELVAEGGAVVEGGAGAAVPCGGRRRAGAFAFGRGVVAARRGAGAFGRVAVVRRRGALQPVAYGCPGALGVSVRPPGARGGVRGRPRYG